MIFEPITYNVLKLGKIKVFNTRSNIEPITYNVLKLRKESKMFIY